MPQSETETPSSRNTTGGEPDPADPSPAMDHILPSSILSTVLSNLDIRSLVAAASTSRSLHSSAAHTLSFLPSFHFVEIAPTLDMLRPLLLPNPRLRSLRLDCSRLDDSSIEYLAKASLHELCLLNCENLSGRLLAELGDKCRDLRILSVNSLAERRGLSKGCSDLKQLLNGCLQLESLRLAFDVSTFNDPKFDHVWAASLERLSSLEIGYIPVTMLLKLFSLSVQLQQPLHHALTFPNLQKLCLSVDCITDNMVRSISTALPSLTHLDLQDAPIMEPRPSSDLSSDGLRSINPYGKLRHISLVRSQEFLFTSFRQVNDFGVMLMLETCSKLESICLEGFSCVTDLGFKEIIRSCSGLRKLSFSHGSQVTDFVFSDISATSLSLTLVSLRRCKFLSNVGIERLSSNRELNVLDLRDCLNLGDEALKAVSCLPKLQILLLDRTGITGLGLSYLGYGKCPLVSLSLRGCRRLTDKCIASLFGGSIRLSLQVLDLSRLPCLSDIGIEALARSRVPIVELRMRECQHIGDNSLMALASMQLDDGTHGSSLQVLDLYECCGITALAIRWFKKPYFPRLRLLGITGSLTTFLPDALSRNRPFLRTVCHGEELGTGYWDTNSNWNRYEEDHLDEIEQWLLEEDLADADEDMEELLE
ncbi:F-box/LRR-repeat protein 10-like [Typha latifolia]|uniref:F-box/LRR-repeat protein 10-like n=1 Tax=Typha latifolia TaxID=4733 RepID=UPI003C2CEE5E